MLLPRIGAAVELLIGAEPVGLKVVGAFDGTRAGTGGDMGCFVGGRAGGLLLVGAGTGGAVGAFVGLVDGGAVGCLVGCCVGLAVGFLKV